MKRFKILFIANVWGNGGIEKVILNYCKLLSKDKYEIFVLTLDEQESIFTEEVKKAGAIFLKPTCIIKGNPLRKQAIRRKIVVDTVKKYNFDLIHYHNSLPISYSYIKSIKKVSPKSKCILHSHGDNAEAPFIFFKKIQNYVYKRIYKNIPDFCTACSEKAGKWMFCNSIYRSNKYLTLVNAFDTKLYSFNQHNREKFRNKYNIENEYVIGTIGRFCYQKYPQFTLEILKNLRLKKQNFKFIWVGNGPEFEEIKKLAYDYKLLNNIIFIESTNDVPSFLSAIDLFILPSRYEGLVLVLIEAQSSGLNILASEKISREVKITNNIKFLPIDNTKIWVDEIVEKITNNLLETKTITSLRKYPKEELSRSSFNYEILKKNLNLIYDKLLEGDK